VATAAATAPHGFRRTAERRFAPRDDDRALDDDRVLDHRLDQLIFRQLCRVDGCGRGFLFPQQLARRHVQLSEKLLQLCRRIGRLQVLDDLRLHAFFAQQRQCSARGVAARIVVDRDRHPFLLWVF